MVLLRLKYKKSKNSKNKSKKEKQKTMSNESFPSSNTQQELSAAHAAATEAVETTRAVGAKRAFGNQEKKDSIKLDGIRVEDNNIVGSDYDIVVPDARLNVDVHDIYDGLTASTKEKTGIYDGSTVYRDGTTDHEPVYVERPDGKGGTYEAEIKGKNAEKMNAIILARAARKIGSAAVRKEEMDSWEDQVAKAA